MSPERVVHLSQKIVRAITQSKEAELLASEKVVLQQIRNVLSEQLEREEKVDQAVHQRIRAFRPHLSPANAEWQTLYAKFHADEAKKIK
ncbi:MAG: DUF507 family protein [Deltaproteobacteria bacterium]|nr:DUF507 family protein [Deltaproteobacteria bacterium]